MVTQIIDRAKYNEEYALLMIRIITEFQERELNAIDGATFAETYTLNAVIKKFGEEAYDVAYSEVVQLHQRGVVSPVKVEDMTPEE